MNTIKVPSISGYESKFFENNFWKDFPMDPETKLPKVGGIGTLGVHHNVLSDLKALWTKSNNDASKFDLLMDSEWKSPNSERNKKSARNKPKDLKQLNAFFIFAIGDQLYFFLRKGCKLLGLCKKIGGYSFQFDPQDPLRYPHRISFEFIRPATDAEQKEFDSFLPEDPRQPGRLVGTAVRTFMCGCKSSTLVLPAPAPASAPAPQAEEAKVVDPEARLAEISSELSAIAETIKALATEQEKLMKEQCDIQDKMKAAPSKAKPPRDLWKQKVFHDEDVLLTTHQNSIPDAGELAGPRFKIRTENGVFKEFFILANGATFRNPSALCKAVFQREGKTNEWRGPIHCLVQRNGTWVPLAKL